MTFQVREELILEGERVLLESLPHLPAGHPGVQAVPHGPKDPPLEPPILDSTACWRRYQGTWELREGRLYLTALRGKWRLIDDEPLHAAWISETIEVARAGETLQIELRAGIEVARRTVYPPTCPSCAKRVRKVRGFDRAPRRHSAVLVAGVCAIVLGLDGLWETAGWWFLLAAPAVIAVSFALQLLILRLLRVPGDGWSCAAH